jgi:hypothetical protein
MRVFRTQRDLDRSTNFVIGRFFLIIFLITLAYGAALAAHYMLGWW